MSVPTIDTERLILRAHRPADLDDCTAMWADPAVTRFISATTFTREQTWGKILRYAGLWALLGYGYWAIEDKATGRFAGELGFADFKRDIDPVYAALPEMGWVLTSGAHGRGYATEALRAALAWSDAHLRAAQTICLIAPENHASLRVAGKAGFRESAHIRFHENPTLVFARPSANSAAELDPAADTPAATAAAAVIRRDAS